MEYILKIQKNPQAIRLDKLSYNEAFEKRLQILDNTAIALGMEHRMPIFVFSIKDNEYPLYNLLKNKLPFSLIM